MLAALTATSAYATTSKLWDIIDNTGGDVLTFGFQDYGMGVSYENVPNGTYDSVTNPNAVVNGNSTNIFTGLSAWVGSANTNVSWDSWGIARLISIEGGGAKDNLPGATLGVDFEVCALFWGEQDSAVTIGPDPYDPANLRDFSVQGSGMQFAVFEIPKTAIASGWHWLDTTLPTFTGVATQGAAGLNTMTGGATATRPYYTGITDVGTYLFGGSSAMVGGRPEFVASYSLDTLGVLGGVQGLQEAHSGFFADSPNSQNGWGSGPLNPHFAALPKSLKLFQFGQDLQNTERDLVKPRGGDVWDDYSHDPLNLRTPELSSSTLMLLGFVPIGIGWWRRRRS